jgi:hypothetical protein
MYIHTYKIVEALCAVLILFLLFPSLCLVLSLFSLPLFYFCYIFFFAQCSMQMQHSRLIKSQSRKQVAPTDRVGKSDCDGVEKPARASTSSERNSDWDWEGKSAWISKKSQTEMESQIEGGMTV